MTAPVAETACAATGLLRTFNEAGVLDLADVHTARRVADLGGETDDAVRLAVALTVRALRLGSVCIDLPTVARTIGTELPWPDPAAWQSACRRSPLIAGAGEPGRPLRLVGDLLYLDRYWRQEEQVRRELHARAAGPGPPADLDRLRTDLARLFPGADARRQRLAAAVCTLRRVSVLAGGPGTGKTTTIARLLAVLTAQPGGPPRVALAAPTGKAAARLEEAVREGTAGLPGADRAALGDLSASTLHRLLGRRPGSQTRFRHDRTNRLPYDVVVVDETSMVSLTLMARLIEAVRPDARLVLVGDPDQLASVEAGAVLGDIVRAPGPPSVPAALSALGLLDPGETVVHGVVTLTRTWRFGGAIAELATAVRTGDADAAVAVLHSGDPSVSFAAPSDVDAVKADTVAALAAVTAAAEAGDPAAALRHLDTHRLLCAHREGPYGVTRWTREITRWLGLAPADEWPPGHPLLITANDYDAGLYNGDTGVVVATPAGPRAAFARGGAPVLIPPSRLSEARTMYALTVHRSQGSQFDRVSLILPEADSPLLTRELLYTAVTRARTSLRILGTDDAVRAAIARPVARASGLRTSLAAP